MTFNQEVDRILAKAMHRLTWLGVNTRDHLNWIMLDEQRAYQALPVSFDPRAEARRLLAEWYRKAFPS